ncbi:MAG: hypothetical protein IAG10_02645 [Planctomycetaceae bacterium]|nr:hypothetical protein [Planctomycetaceae bacterium]
MITPSTARLYASGTTVFTANPAAVNWEIAPVGTGAFDVATLTYTAPGQIAEWKEIALIAKDAANAEVGRATITLLPPPLKVNPATVELVSGQQQAFSVEPAEPVRWEPPATGKMTIEGVYTAPSFIFTPRTVVITARNAGNSQRFAHTTVTLQDTPFKRLALGTYFVLLGAILVCTAICLWGSLCTPVKTPQVLVSPPIITLRPGGTVSLAASVPGTTDDGTAKFTWSKSETGNNGQTGTGKLDEASGVYVAPATILKADRVVVTAKKKDEPSTHGSSLVMLSKESQLQVLPPVVIVRASQVIPFTVVSERLEDAKVRWTAQPNLGQISADGIYQAPDVVSESQTVTILARSVNDPRIQAGANVTLIASVEVCSPRKQNILIFVLVMGALGSLLHAVASFGSFVGNKQFAPSWCWWYVFKPCLGSGLALVVFFVVGRGFIVGESVDNLFGIAMISSLVGLFSDQAMLKLQELTETLLATKSPDSRNGKLRANATRPTIASITPPTIVHGTSPAPSLEISGTNFVNGCKVKVNGSLRTPSSTDVTKVTIGLTDADIAVAGKLKLVVVNPNAETSDEAEVSIT